MITDWLLIRRAARELSLCFRGARVRDVGAMPDGRPALALWSGGSTRLLCVDAFGSPPLLTVEDGELPIAAEPGFVRALGAALRGASFEDAQSVRGDRVVRLTFGARSSFGVVSAASLVVELVPRFGNAVLLKGETVVAALREFSPAENPARSILAGHAYEPPPVGDRPALPKLLAAGYAPDAAAEIVARGDANDATLDDLFVYRRDGELQQAYVVALAAFSDCACTREPSLLDCFGEFRARRIARGTAAGVAQRRAVLAKALAKRERRLREELASLARQRDRIVAREELKVRGQTLFATLYELDEAAQTEAKDEAAKLFAKYKNLGAALPHVEQREARVRLDLDAVLDLQWEVERAGDADVADVGEAVRALEPRKAQSHAKAAKRKKRPPLSYRTSSGSRILVGRTPFENAELTFRVARPNDLWFHAQGQPGAHVILQRDDRAAAPDDDVAAAASLAALHSKGKTSAKVAVDYAQRKYVRKQPNAAPGLVFYTDFTTIDAAPATEDALRRLSNSN